MVLQCCGTWRCSVAAHGVVAYDVVSLRCMVCMVLCCCSVCCVWWCVVAVYVLVLIPTADGTARYDSRFWIAISNVFTQLWRSNGFGQQAHTCTHAHPAYALAYAHPHACTSWQMSESGSALVSTVLVLSTAEVPDSCWLPELKYPCLLPKPHHVKMLETWSSAAWHVHIPLRPAQSPIRLHSCTAV